MTASPPPLVAIVGRSGVGKTTLIEKLLPELKRRGYRVGTIKHHAHPGFEMDQPGKDSWRHAAAGSDHVVLAAPDRVASIRRVAADPPLAALAATMTDVDLILADGYRSAPVPRIEVVRAAHNPEPLCALEDLIALVSDVPLETAIPRFGLEDGAALADFIDAFCRARAAGNGAC